MLCVNICLPDSPLLNKPWPLAKKGLRQREDLVQIDYRFNFLYMECPRRGRRIKLSLGLRCCYSSVWCSSISLTLTKSSIYVLVFFPGASSGFRMIKRGETSLSSHHYRSFWWKNQKNLLHHKSLSWKSADGAESQLASGRQAWKQEADSDRDAAAELLLWFRSTN